MENEIKNLIARAINNSHSNAKLSEITLDAAWKNHGPSCTEGSWIETSKSQSDVEMDFHHLDWAQVAEFPNGKVLVAELPKDWSYCAYCAAVPATSVDQNAIVEIDADQYHPAAKLVGTPAPVNTITMILELNAMEDPDTAFAEINGPIVATWFPGESTPRSKPDGVLKTGDKVTVAEAIAHGFQTVKFIRQ